MSIPSLFKKRYTEKKLNKSVLGRVHLPKDKEFLAGLFKQGEDGLWAADLPAEIPKETEKRLASLAKDIKANSGFISLPKAAVLLVVVAGISGGYYLFRNVLAARAIEAGLEAVFRARASVEGVDFDVFGAKISWKALEVADRDKPMKNLFVLGETEADLDMGALLKGKVVIETLAAKGIAWNTDRKTSGALPGAAEPEKKEGGPGWAGSMAGKAVTALASIDPKEILDRQADKLKTGKTVEKLNADFKTQKAGWEAKTSETRKQIDALGTSTKEITAIKVELLKTPEDALKAYDKVAGAVPKLQEAGKTAEALKKDFEASLKAVNQGKSELDKALAEDYAYVESLVKLGSGDTASLAKELFAGYAADKLGAWYGYGLRAAEAAKNLSAARGKGEGEADRPARGKGRTIRFATDEIPRFLLEKASFTGGGAGGPSVEGELANLSSDPELAGGPVRLRFAYVDGGAKTVVEGVLDLRKAAANLVETKASAEDLPLALSFPDSALGVKSLAGPLSVKAVMTVPKAGGMKGSADAAMKSPRVERSGGGGAVSDLVVSVLAGARTLDAKIEYAAGKDGGFDLSVSSSLDKLVKTRLSAFLKEQEKKYVEMLKKELSKRLEGLLAENETLRKGFAALDRAVGGNYADVAAYKKAAEDKKLEIEKRADALRKQAADALLKETQKALPQIQKPKLPKLP